MTNDVDLVWDDVYRGSGRTRQNYDKLRTFYGNTFMSYDDFLSDKRFPNLSNQVRTKH